jgi:UDP-2,3-diacylglucosamine pyrophosphatase LpxH
MIVLVSDLHLAESPGRTTIEVAPLLRHLTNMIELADERKVKELTIVLLGDIFELLKSNLWLERGVRPWEAPCTPEHVNIVTDIFQRIVSANEDFFSGLRALTQKHEFVKLLYIPGNHDRALNTEMGKEARRALRDRLPLTGSGDQEFPDDLLDEEHKLIAHHGHEWDMENRYVRDSAALGDAVVIEFVLQLPHLVLKKLGTGDGDSTFNFLFEIDNVRPHSPEVLWQWVEASAAGVEKAHPDIARAIRESLDEVVNRLNLLMRKGNFESYVTAKRRFDSLTWLLKKAIKYLDYKRVVRMLPAGELDAYPDIALHNLKSMQDRGRDFRYFVCGHTHNPLMVPLEIGPPSTHLVGMYLNTGTWRRVRRLASSNNLGAQAAAFSCWNEECVVSIYNEEEQGLGYPSYDFYRVTRGANN